MGSANHTERALARLRRGASSRSGFEPRPWGSPIGRHAMLLLAVACAAMTVPAAAQTLQAPNGQPVTLASPVAPVKGGTAVYLVQLKDAPAASYGGRKAGFAATKPLPGDKLDRTASSVASYAKHVEQSHDRVLAEIGAAGSKVYSFRYVLNGFAARLDAEQVSRLAQRGDVERVWLDSKQRIQTNNSSAFLGVQDTDAGLRAKHGLSGEGVIIGVIDSGVAPGHPSLEDVIRRVPRACESNWARASWLGRWLCHSVRRNPPTERVYEPPDDFHGACEEGEGFTAADCNNKLVGARYYIDGFLAQYELHEEEFISPRDAHGHGTHVATIAAGNSSVSARLFDTRVARISGIAPRARIAVYKACWLEPDALGATCATSDLTRAIDDAVADGVDIISYSVGTTLGETDLTAPDDLALLNALDAGVLAVVAAGNDGPELATIGSPASAPWVLTAAASTQTGTLFDTAIAVTAPEDLARNLQMREASFTPPLRARDGIDAALVLVDDGGSGSRRDACDPLANGADLTGAVALIERGGCQFQAKLERVEQAGAVAAIVYNTSGAPMAMNGDTGSVDIPAVMIGASDGQMLVNRLTAGERVEVQLRAGLVAELRDTGNYMAEFSSRGPSLSDPDFLKPDLTAPGVDILAGHSPDTAVGLRGETFQYLSGTSQAAPEIAGVAALLREAHPDWLPGTLKSALMTSARRNVVRDGGETAADALDMGAGHVDANRALDPGLTFDSDVFDYAAYLCGFDLSPVLPEDCDALLGGGYSLEARDVNLPSISISTLITGDTVTRRVTNRGPAGQYTASVTAPPGIDIVVEPAALSLGTEQTGELTVRFVDHGAELDAWSFGEVRFTDGTRQVAIPVALQPVALRAPLSVRLAGTSGTFTVPMAFGYDGEYFAGMHGLRAPATVQQGFVEDDPTNTFGFRIGNGVRMHELPAVPPDQLYLRVALFDELTDGADDLDLYLFYCPDNLCSQVASSGSFTSEEVIDLVQPAAGRYVALVHGFETDEVAGGPGANYTLHGWTIGMNDDAGNLRVTGPAAVAQGDRVELELDWSGLEPATRYLGIITHETPGSIYSFSTVAVDTY